MSARLVAAGHTVIGYDVSEQARQGLAAAGGHDQRSLGDVAKGARLVILMLPNSDVVASVLEDATLLERLEPGAIVVDMSSSEPLRTRALAESLGKRAVRMLDAPVSGGVSGAEAGKLTIMVGGDASDMAEAKPYLAELGRVVHVGPIGAGHAVKALNNLLSATHLWVTSEAMLVGERFGIDPEVMLSVFNSSSGRSGSTENKWPNFIIPGTFDSGFGLRLMLKDMNIAIQLAKQVGAPDALGSCALDLWDRASQSLPATADHTEIARWLADGVSTSGQ
jgi:3-hydroxyisobutyrate dehydrogenase